ncbi:MAG TPA: protein translocase subunit SecD [Solirubrobacterales bacterium]|nr:protein translocase subunit SecD [Solirubrobacterales bacterium]
MASRTRNLIILGLVVALLGGSVAAIILKPTRLGLDLAGGISLVYKAVPSEPGRQPSDRELQNAIKVINDRINALGTTEAEVQTAGGDLIEVSIPDIADPQRAIDLVGSTAKLLFYKWEANIVGGPDREDSISATNSKFTQGYTNLFDAVELASKQKGSTGKADQSNDGVPRARLYLFDKNNKKLHAGPSFTKRDLLGGNDVVTKRPLGGNVPKGTSIVTVPRGIAIVQQKPQTTSKFAKPQFFVIRDNTSLTGDDVKNATPGTDQAGAPAVDLAFTGKGGDIFHKITRELYQEGNKEVVIGNRAAGAHTFAIVLDGAVVSRASIDPTDGSLRDGIAGGRAQITGVTPREARDISQKVDLGALPVDLQLISQTQVSASLGKQALHQGLIAGLVGFGLVFFFLLAFYRVLGLIAGIALVIYAVLFFAVTKVAGFTFTLPGIAGLVLTLSVAADANIVIFERIKEEVRAGRSMKAAISTGYSKGFATILDANVVTLVTAFILFVLATSGVRGFAAALGLGTIVSLFTAVAATSAILGLFAGTRAIQRPSALGAHASDQKDRWRFDFMGKSKYFFSASGLILVIGALGVAGSGLNLGIDFTGGTKVTVGLERTVSETQIRQEFDRVGAGDAKIQRITGDKDLGTNAFQVASDKLDPSDVAQVRKDLNQRFDLKGTGANEQFTTQSVGPTFGAVVARSAIIAIIFSLLVIGGYVALRFSAKFSVPVLIAITHDIVITLGVYALLGREVSSATVAALLTILGFSLYDTIIVLDRIRENLPRMPRAAFSQIVNRSMSEVLTRSLATSFVTALPITALLLFGGETLKDFAFALLIGTLSGTYSSIFIASPVLTHWKEREPLFRQRRERIAAENNGVVPPFAVETIGGVETGFAESRPGDAAIDKPVAVVEEIPEEAPVSNGAATADGVTSGNVARPTTKAARRAARQRRKHGRPS